MSGLNVDALMPEMTIKVTMGDFHSIHGRAMAAKERVAKEVQRMSIPELRQALEALRAGQRLAGAENGPDFMFATDYSLAILAVLAELRRRFAEQV